MALARFKASSCVDIKTLVIVNCIDYYLLVSICYLDK